MNIDVKIYSKTGNVPKYQTTGAAGLDLSYSGDYFIELYSGQTRMIETGVHVEIPQGFVGMVCSRSGLAAKNSVFVVNAPGIVDSDYRGEIKVILHNLGEDTLRINPGDRIAQLVISPVVQANFNVVESVDDLGTTDRGSGGFGSSGR